MRPQGESIVDISWASPGAARRVESWKVLSEVESLSDHVYIEIEKAISNRGEREPRKDFPIRWSVQKMDQDKMVATLIACSWVEEEEELTIEKDVQRLRDKLTRSCDVAMPRNCPRSRKAVH